MNYKDIRPLTIRCDAVILAKCKAIAKLNRRSMNSQIEDFLAHAIDDYEKEHGDLTVEIDEE